MERKGFTPPELEGLPELPECASHVWDWYEQLTNRRTTGAISVNPITWPDLESWSNLTGIKPRQWELDCIAQIDLAWRISITPESKE